MMRGNIAATTLKMLWKNLYSVKSYNKLNMNVFALSLWENFWWGFIYFDQFISKTHNLGQSHNKLDSPNVWDWPSLWDWSRL